MTPEEALRKARTRIEGHFISQKMRAEILGSVDISFHARLNPIAYVQNDPAGITEGSRCVEGAKRRRPPER